MDEFRFDNTAGYTESELDIMNALWKDKARDMELELGSYEYFLYLRDFQNWISNFDISLITR